MNKSITSPNVPGITINISSDSREHEEGSVSEPLITRQDKKLSLRQLMKKGDYEQICLIVPKALKRRLKLVQIKKGVNGNMSDFAREAIEDWLSKQESIA